MYSRKEETNLSEDISEKTSVSSLSQSTTRTNSVLGDFANLFLAKTNPKPKQTSTQKPSQEIKSSNKSQKCADKNFAKNFNKLSHRKIRTHLPIHGGKNLYLPSHPFSELHKYDLSEITGLDDLHNPESLIAKAQTDIAELFQVEHSFFSVGGASTCLLASCLALGEGGKVLVPTNAHKSVISGLILSGAEPIWYEPEWDAEWGIFRDINLNQIAKLIEANSSDKSKSIKGCFVTSPTYEGIEASLEELVSLCHDHEIPVIVDESHGGHLSLINPGRGAINACADLVIHSPHKTLGAMTQTGLLHVQSELISAQKVAACMSLLQTTSPSWILLASLIEMTNYLKGNLQHLHNQISIGKDLKRRLSKIDKVKIFQNDDSLKCILSLEGVIGHELSEWLFENHDIETEMEGADWVLLLATMSLQSHHVLQIERIIQKASKALSSPKENGTLHPASRQLLSASKESKTDSFVTLKIKPPQIITEQLPRKAFFENDNSKIEFKCPPGIPTQIPGSRIILNSEVSNNISKEIESIKEVDSEQNSELNLDNVLNLVSKAPNTQLANNTQLTTQNTGKTDAEKIEALKRLVALPPKKKVNKEDDPYFDEDFTDYEEDLANDVYNTTRVEEFA